MNGIVEQAAGELLGQWGAAGAIILILGVGTYFVLKQLQKMTERLISSQEAQIQHMGNLWHQEREDRRAERQVMVEATAAMRQATDKFDTALRLMERHL